MSSGGTPQLSRRHAALAERDWTLAAGAEIPSGAARSLSTKTSVAAIGTIAPAGTHHVTLNLADEVGVRFPLMHTFGVSFKTTVIQDQDSIVLYDALFGAKISRRVPGGQIERLISRDRARCSGRPRVGHELRGVALAAELLHQPGWPVSASVQSSASREPCV